MYFYSFLSKMARGNMDKNYDIIYIDINKLREHKMLFLMTATR
ncbi:hypothetical protein XBP1_720065 [Xenorhabdus bovienii str. puntauvense]|uniref:Uncharacterized protein n=2 Tax=Xenorhabdus bovienii TaxID=40576 RepID=A0A077NJT5_XENBV|nr:hypothetical protein XBP1_720065 [Xenorhabdus bovienii str. puntauvense]CDH03551.1 hypothetical protein XBFM1_810065 [Xenorhabdus bovienii str. feltiae Moldova]